MIKRVERGYLKAKATLEQENLFYKAVNYKLSKTYDTYSILEKFSKYVSVR
ncbi:MAG: hypothetical protein LBD84_02990 [Campylobacteraceae bacterium]|jgi:hypothetical protein|nr:hypothetical protein [Campylobacteraceae bacterium]